MSIVFLAYQRQQEEGNVVPGQIDYASTVHGLEEWSFKKPMGVAVDEKDGKIYVSDADQNVILAKANFLGTKIIGESDQLKFPLDIVIKDDLLFVGDFYNSKVQVYSTGGKKMASLPKPEDKEKTGPIRPLALGVDAHKNLYVFDSSRQRVMIFDQNGDFQESFGTPGSGKGQFNFVNGIAIDNKRNLVYLADSNNSRIQVLDLQGEYIRTIEKMGSEQVKLVLPRGLSIDEENSILFITDAFAHTVYLYNPEKDEIIDKIKTGGAENSSLNLPNDVFYSAKYNQIMITDKGNQRVLVYKYQPVTDDNK